MSEIIEASQLAMDLISRLYHVPFAALDSRQITDELCRRYRHHAIQYYFDEKVLDMTRQNVENNAIYHISDAFLIHFLIFTVDNRSYMLGPFCTVVLTDRELAILLERCGVSGLDMQAFKVYRSAFPVLSERDAYRIARTFIQTLSPEEQEKTIRPITFSPEYTDTMPEHSGQEEHRIMLVERRYARDRAFMESVRSGKTREAIYNLNALRTATSYLSQMHLGATMENHRVGAATIRSELRVIAIEAGLPAHVVDQIASTNYSDTLKARTPDEILISEEKMVRSFCHAIRQERSKKYSALTQSVLYILENDYASELHLAEIAEDLNVSEAFLITCFRKEVGIPPNAYLTKTRMKKAARLLSSGGMTVAGVSSAVGILDANYFVKLFKKEYGETPSAYRKRHTV